MIGMFPPAKGQQVHEDSTGFFRGLVQDARDSSMESITPGDEERAFYRLPVWKRIIVMFGGPFMNLVLAVVLFGVLLMGFGVAQPSTTVGSVSACALPATSERQTCDPAIRPRRVRAAGIEPGDRIVSVAGQPIDDVERVDRDHPRPPDEPIEHRRRARRRAR
jgi:membrane-associated protease RseP (regulator of RpoE activity)